MSELDSWKVISKQKKNEQYARIPTNWRLQSAPSPDVTSFVGLVSTCGVLDEEELRITERYDAVGLAGAIRERSLRCVDVARAFCKRAVIAHQLTNCLTEIFFDDALKRAQELDVHLDQGKPPLGPLHGVPISLKDTFKVKGYDASLGIAALTFKPASENSVLVDCLLRAGAVLYCKTNIPQTLMALDSHNNVFGRTLNPIDSQLTAGGSSGGEGALIAMRGSILGIGTDVGGSIRIPSMCNSLYGVKPSWQRIPYAGQQGVQAEGMSKLGIPASAGPIATSMRDIDLFFRAVSEQEPWRLDPDVVPSPWASMSSISDARVRGRKKLRIGVVRRDGIVEPHPPILRLLDEVASRMERTNIEVVNMDVDIEPLFKQCQSLANALFGIDGGNFIFDLLEATNEPLSPWLQTRLKRKNPLSLEQVGELQARRTALQKSFSKVWDSSGIDAFICPVAPHPVPPIDRWNSVSYTSSFVLLDYPAGVIPVRTFERKDMEGEMTTERTGGSWDRANRELWTGFDCSKYVGSPLCVQVVAPRLEERRLVEIMGVIDEAVHRETERLSAKL